MENINYKAKLFEMIVTGKGLQYVMDACSELLGNPIVFANQSLQLVCKCSLCDSFPDAFGWFENQYGENLRIAYEASEAGYFKSIYASDAPVCGTISGISANWIAARVRLRNQILGNVLVSDSHSPFTEAYQELLPLICQTIAFVFQQSGKYDKESQKYDPLLSKLLDGDLYGELDDEMIRAHFRLLGQILPKTFRILVVRPDSSGHMIDYAILDAQMRAQFPSSFGMIYKNDCIRIFDGSFSENIIIERLQNYMPMSHTLCGISRTFESTVFICDAYAQADAAIRLNKTFPDQILACFDDVVGPYLLEQATAEKNMSVERLIMPELASLRGSAEDIYFERLQDLAAYLSCGRNVTRAARLRGIHKNSMYYRLDRIADLTCLDMNNDNVCIQLTISLSLMGFLPFVKHFNIK